MKCQLVTTILFGLLASASSLVPESAYANNRGVENALANYSDVSVFYQALLNTGVLNELNENTRYTVFAPTNEAFAQIQPTLYPCFYAVQCRAQVADVLRNHIVVGRRSLKELTREAEVPTIGRNWVYAESPYVHDYTIANRKVLSGEELNGNMIYRIDGLIVNNQQLARLQTVPPMPLASDDVGAGETIVTYRTPVVYAAPAGAYYPQPVSQTVTRKTYINSDGEVVGGEVTTITQPLEP